MVTNGLRHSKFNNYHCKSALIRGLFSKILIFMRIMNFYQTNPFWQTPNPYFLPKKQIFTTISPLNCPVVRTRRACEAETNPFLISIGSADSIIMHYSLYIMHCLLNTQSPMSFRKRTHFPKYKNLIIPQKTKKTPENQPF
jgi:hypothetical protein